MMQQIVDNAASAASVGTTLAEIMLFLKLAEEYVERKCSEYDSDNLKEMRAIQRSYQLYCYPVEKESFPSTLSVFRDTKSSQNNELPIFFQMQGKIPLLHVAGLGLSTIDHPWDRFLKPTSGLLYYIGEMLKKITIYQQQRGERFFSKDQGFSYDATNMFLEDVKWYLIELSKAEPNKKTLDSVSGRIDYFSDIINKQVFKPGENSPTRVETIIYLRDIFKDWIKPLIQGASYKESAREHFFQLRNQTVSFVNASLSFMFYVFRDASSLPKRLPIDDLRDNDKLFKEAAESISGRLLRELAQTEACKNACIPLTSQNAEEKEEGHEKNQYPDLQFLCKNLFLHTDDQLLFPLTIEGTNINNWFQKPNSGILRYFRKSSIMERFIKVHGLIQEVCLFSVICELLYELAGFKGDFGIYGKAASKVTHAIKTYERRIAELCKEIDGFFEMAQALQKKLFSSGSQKKEIVGFSEAMNWVDYFGVISESYKDIQKNMQDSQEVINKINHKITVLQNDQYLKRFDLLFNFFSQLVDGFVDRDSLLMANVPSIANSPDHPSHALSYEEIARSLIRTDEKIETERDELLRQIESLEQKTIELNALEKSTKKEKEDLEKKSQEEQKEKNKKIDELEEKLQHLEDEANSFFKKYSAWAWGGFFTTAAIAVISATTAIKMGLSRK